MEPLKIKVILGSTRPNRFNDKPGKWIFEEAKKLDGVEVELLDLLDYDLPMFNEPVSPSQIKDGNYGSDIVNNWAKKIGDADAYIIVTPEYNHGPSGVVKNAMDLVYAEWNNKVVGFVSYGSVGGARAIEQLRAAAIELQLACVRTSVHIPGSIIWGTGWNAEAEQAMKHSADTMLEQITRWGRAMKATRV